MKLESTTQKRTFSKGQNRGTSILNFKVLTLVIFSIFFLSSPKIFAHCDSYDGPLIKEAFKALETNNVDLVLKWVTENQGNEIKVLFKKTYKLRTGDKEVYKIVETHFLETLVRLHRETEGAPYTGLKPAGSATPIVKMADISIETKSVDNLLSKLTAHIEKVVGEKFEKVNELQEVKDESLEKGRAYVEAYVDYTHTLEAIHGIIEHSSEGQVSHKH